MVGSLGLSRMPWVLPTEEAYTVVIKPGDSVRYGLQIALQSCLYGCVSVNGEGDSGFTVL
jgi:hypothetical protein